MPKSLTIVPPCPKCSAPNARWLEFTSRTNKINAFQCVACGYAWEEPLQTAPRRHTLAPPFRRRTVD
jgi:Zn ribbon nucleic-acid-binding protein